MQYINDDINCKQNEANKIIEEIEHLKKKIEDYEEENNKKMHEQELFIRENEELKKEQITIENNFKHYKERIDKIKEQIVW